MLVKRSDEDEDQKTRLVQLLVRFCTSAMTRYTSPAHPETRKILASERDRPLVPPRILTYKRYRPHVPPRPLRGLSEIASRFPTIPQTVRIGSASLASNNAAALELELVAFNKPDFLEF
jgi:hypothetical protein